MYLHFQEIILYFEYIIFVFCFVLLEYNWRGFLVQWNLDKGTLTYVYYDYTNTM